MKNVLSFKGWMRVYEQETVDPKKVPYPKVPAGTTHDQVKTVKELTGYDSAMFTNVTYKSPGGGHVYLLMACSKKLGQVTNQNIYYLGDYSFGATWGPYAKDKPPTTRAEVKAIVEKCVPGTDKVRTDGVNYCIGPRSDSQYNSTKPFLIKAGGKWTDKNNKTHTWGRPGTTVGDEIVDIVCAQLGITS